MMNISIDVLALALAVMMSPEFFALPAWTANTMPTIARMKPMHVPPQKSAPTMLRISGSMVFTSPPAPGIIGPPGGGKPPLGPKPGLPPP